MKDFRELADFVKEEFPLWEVILKVSLTIAVKAVPSLWRCFYNLLQKRGVEPRQIKTDFLLIPLVAETGCINAGFSTSEAWCGVVPAKEPHTPVRILIR